MANFGGTLTSQVASMMDVSSRYKDSMLKGNISKCISKNKKTKFAFNEVGAIFEKSEIKESILANEKTITPQNYKYSINKMSKEDRACLVQQMQEEQQSIKDNFIDIVNKTIFGQNKANCIATNDESFWQMISKGDFTIDETARNKAQEDISENGYWGIKQTSQRLFDFASVLASDDVDLMKQMQGAMQKGFDEAKIIWGRDLSDISSNTLDAANKLFKNYYNSKA